MNRALRATRVPPARIVALLIIVASAIAPVAAAVVERFDADPLAGAGASVFFPEGDTAARFAWLAAEPSHFPGDRQGTLRVLYDTTLPAARIATPLGRVLSLSEDFYFGAILTLRSPGFSASPDGFSQIAFGLWNARTTGMNRTGFPADSFDLVEFDYFPNVTSFGGPFLSPSVFGGDAGGNAFFNFAFQSAERPLPLDVPLLCELRYTATDRRLSVGVSRHRGGPFFERLPGAGVTVDLSGLDPTFLVDVLGIAAYFEGYPSIRVSVDYDLIFEGDLPAPFRLLARRFRTAPAGE